MEAGPGRVFTAKELDGLPRAELVELVMSQAAMIELLMARVEHWPSTCSAASTFRSSVAPSCSPTCWAWRSPPAGVGPGGRGRRCLVPFVGKLATLLGRSPVIGADETGGRVGWPSAGSTWLCTPTISLIVCHRSRGMEAVRTRWSDWLARGGTEGVLEHRSCSLAGHSMRFWTRQQPLKPLAMGHLHRWVSPVRRASEYYG